MKKWYFQLLCVMMLSIMASSCDDDDFTQSPGQVTDNYIGNCRLISFTEETADFDKDEFTLYILAPDGNVITRNGRHSRSQGVSSFEIVDGLKDEEYTLLCLEYALDNTIDGRFTKANFGLGCKVKIYNSIATVTSEYDPTLKLFKSDAGEKTYNISCDMDLLSLAEAVNVDNSIIDSTYTFVQLQDIDLAYACYVCSKNYGWYPIGCANNTPFTGTYDGGNFNITSLEINRPTSYGVGLFGYTYMAYIKNVNIVGASIYGDFAVGGLAGAVITSGDIKACTVIDLCNVSNSTISGGVTSAGQQGVDIGGLVGAVDQFSTLCLSSSSSSNNTILAAYNAGGLVGGGCSKSIMIVGNCNSNNRCITAQYSGAGGIIATADSVMVSACTNSSPVTGGVAQDYAGIGTGGIIGGSGAGYISGCTNSGTIIGDEGVGGIVGSTRIKGSRDANSQEAYMYNYTIMKYCGNSGSVSGNFAVGGICGDSNLGCYGVYNKGSVSGKAQVGGILGSSFIAVVHNSVNSGDVTATNHEGGSYCGGIIGKADMSSIALDHNYGAVSTTGSHTAGIIGLSGQNTVIHQCGNFGNITSTSDGAIGGLVGEIGDPREWSKINIAEVVIGSVELVMAVAGPVMAYYEHTTEGAKHLILKIAEPVIELGIDGLNIYLLDHSIHTIMHGEHLEMIDAAVNASAISISEDVIKQIAKIREAVTVDISDFNSDVVTTHYKTTIDGTLEFYESTGGADIYNGNINNKRNELSEEIAESVETQEIVHTVISGVAIGASILATIGVILASGGAAAGFATLGAATSIVSGVNAIVKGSTDFADNAVIISQCLNAGYISSPASSQKGGLVGKLNDRSIMRDCLNTAKGDNTGGCFVGTAGSDISVERCLNISDPQKWEDVIVSTKITATYKENYYYFDDTKFESLNAYATPLTAQEISAGTEFSSWDIGSGQNIWIIPSVSSGNTFPIPNYSEMCRPLE